MQSLKVVEMGARMGLGLILALLILTCALPAQADTPKIQRDQIADDAIGEEQIDWGDTGEQVDASDVPVDDAAWVEITPVSPDVQSCFDWIDANWPAGGSAVWQKSGTDLSPLTSGDDVLMNPTELIKAEGAAASDIKLYHYVTGDSYGRFQAKADGTLEWGSGSAAVDTSLYRSAANKLASPDAFVITNSDYQKTIEATNGITGSTNSSYGIHGTSTGGPIASYGVYGTTTSSTATFCAGVGGYANATGTNEYGGYFQTAGTASGQSHGVYCSTSGSGNDDYSVYAADRIKAGIWADFDEHGIAGSPRLTPPPSGDARMAYFSDDLWYAVNDAGKVYGWSDADGDTKIEVEESADEDKIRMDSGGTERLVLDSTGADFAVEVSAHTNFDVDGTNGIGVASMTLITDVDFNTMQIKYRTLTFVGGILTADTGESGWTAAPLNP